MKFLSYDSKFGQIILKFCYACWLNMLWMVCSLPIVTIGASTTALYYATLKLARGEEGDVTKMFFHSFRQNFKQATILWGILLGVGLFLALDYYVLIHLRQTSQGAVAVAWTVILAIVIAATVMYAIELVFVFPLLSRVENTVWAMLKNSFLIGTHYLFCTIVVFAIHFAIFFVTVRFFTPLLIAGEGLSAMLSSIFLWRVIDACTYDPEDQEEGEEAGEEEEAP